MTIDYKKLRLSGVYRQDDEGSLMLRVKIPAGLMSSEQAAVLGALGVLFGSGTLHLTSRCSIEFHRLRYEQLEEIFSHLGGAGLTTRGACGGAVRGISCSTTFAPGYPAVQKVAKKINRHFAGNPDFEGLPKKFKIGIDAGYKESRHLIQDLGLVRVAVPGKNAAFDVWCAGGLGREPRAAFLLEKEVPEERLIHLIECIVHIYRENAPDTKRLKYLLGKIGEEAFRKLLETERKGRSQPAENTDENDHIPVPEGTFLEIPVFAGELKATALKRLAAVAVEHGTGHIAVTADQNIALLTTSESEKNILKEKLVKQDLKTYIPGFPARFRVCPGTHECPRGLSPTREIARQVAASMNRSAAGKSWAISGCSNGCSQPHLADYGIITSKLRKDDQENQHPVFDLYCRSGEGLGQCIEEGLDDSELCEAIRMLR